MLSAQPTQFKLSEDGKVTYQPKLNNPLPGEPVAVLRKGASILEPALDMIEAESTKALDASAVREQLQAWLKSHIETILAPLVALRDDSELQGSARGIAFQVYESLGIVPREQLEDLIAGLDQDSRRALRGKRIRLGPILVFQPDLNKPAAVRLRALLWSLYNDKPLPARVPNDGVVSVKIDVAQADRAFYQAIGYPLYGSRVIRIDMLDRVINAIYEQADGGKFKAKHEMAEWLGCPIDDLYEILHAMGHLMIFNPALQENKAEDGAEQVAEQAVEQPPAQESAPEVVVEAPASEQAQAPEGGDAETPAQQAQSQVKPELATFRLKRGKAFEKPSYANKAAQGDGERKPRKDFSGNKDGRRPDARKDEERKGGKGKRNKATNRPTKIMSAGPEKKLEDSPFAILGQLKAKKDAS
jgi:ATP-dependent RNA helicase SUPV3L1/SUV3